MTVHRRTEALAQQQQQQQEHRRQMMLLQQQQAELQRRVVHGSGSYNNNNAYYRSAPTSHLASPAPTPVMGSQAQYGGGNVMYASSSPAAAAGMPSRPALAASNTNTSSSSAHVAAMMGRGAKVLQTMLNASAPTSRNSSIVPTQMQYQQQYYPQQQQPQQQRAFPPTMPFDNSMANVQRSYRTSALIATNTQGSDQRSVSMPIAVMDENGFVLPSAAQAAQMRLEYEEQQRAIMLADGASPVFGSGAPRLPIGGSYHHDDRDPDSAPPPPTTYEGHGTAVFSQQQKSASGATNDGSDALRFSSSGNNSNFRPSTNGGGIAEGQRASSGTFVRGTVRAYYRDADAGDESVISGEGGHAIIQRQPTPFRFRNTEEAMVEDRDLRSTRMLTTELQRQRQQPREGGGAVSNGLEVFGGGDGRRAVETVVLREEQRQWVASKQQRQQYTAQQRAAMNPPPQHQQQQQQYVSSHRSVQQQQQPQRPLRSEHEAAAEAKQQLRDLNVIAKQLSESPQPKMQQTYTAALSSDTHHNKNMLPHYPHGRDGVEAPNNNGGVIYQRTASNTSTGSAPKINSVSVGTVAEQKKLNSDFSGSKSGRASPQPKRPLAEKTMAASTTAATAATLAVSRNDDRSAHRPDRRATSESLVSKAPDPNYFAHIHRQKQIEEEERARKAKAAEEERLRREEAERRARVGPAFPKPGDDDHDDADDGVSPLPKSGGGAILATKEAILANNKTRYEDLRWMLPYTSHPTTPAVSAAAAVVAAVVGTDATEVPLAPPAAMEEEVSMELPFPLPSQNTKKARQSVVTDSAPNVTAAQHVFANPPPLPSSFLNVSSSAPAPVPSSASIAVESMPPTGAVAGLTTQTFPIPSAAEDKPRKSFVFDLHKQSGASPILPINSFALPTAATTTIAANVSTTVDAQRTTATAAELSFVLCSTPAATRNVRDNGDDKDANIDHDAVSVHQTENNKRLDDATDEMTPPPPPPKPIAQPTVVEVNSCSPQPQRPSMTMSTANATVEALNKDAVVNGGEGGEGVRSTAVIRVDGSVSFALDSPTNTDVGGREGSGSAVAEGSNPPRQICYEVSTGISRNGGGADVKNSNKNASGSRSLATKRSISQRMMLMKKKSVSMAKESQRRAGGACGGTVSEQRRGGEGDEEELSMRFVRKSPSVQQKQPSSHQRPDALRNDAPMTAMAAAVSFSATPSSSPQPNRAQATAVVPAEGVANEGGSSAAVGRSRSPQHERGGATSLPAAASLSPMTSPSPARGDDVVSVCDVPAVVTSTSCSPQPIQPESEVEAGELAKIRSQAQAQASASVHVSSNKANVEDDDNAVTASNAAFFSPNTSSVITANASLAAMESRLSNVTERLTQLLLSGGGGGGRAAGGGVGAFSPTPTMAATAAITNTTVSMEMDAMIAQQQEKEVAASSLLPHQRPTEAPSVVILAGGGNAPPPSSMLTMAPFPIQKPNTVSRDLFAGGGADMSSFYMAMNSTPSASSAFLADQQQYNNAATTSATGVLPSHTPRSSATIALTNTAQRLSETLAATRAQMAHVMTSADATSSYPSSADNSNAAAPPFSTGADEKDQITVTKDDETAQDPIAAAEKEYQELRESQKLHPNHHHPRTSSHQQQGGETPSRGGIFSNNTHTSSAATHHVQEHIASIIKSISKEQQRLSAANNTDNDNAATAHPEDDDAIWQDRSASRSDGNTAPAIDGKAAANSSHALNNVSLNESSYFHHIANQGGLDANSSMMTTTEVNTMAEEEDEPTFADFDQFSASSFNAGRPSGANAVANHAPQHQQESYMRYAEEDDNNDGFARMSHNIGSRPTESPSSVMKKKRRYAAEDDDGDQDEALPRVAPIVPRGSAIESQLTYSPGNDGSAEEEQREKQKGALLSSSSLDDDVEISPTNSSVASSAATVTAQSFNLAVSTSAAALDTILSTLTNIESEMLANRSGGGFASARSSALIASAAADLDAERDGFDGYKSAAVAAALVPTTNTTTAIVTADDNVDDLNASVDMLATLSAVLSSQHQRQEEEDGAIGFKQDGMSFTDDSFNELLRRTDTQRNADADGGVNKNIFRGSDASSTDAFGDTLLNPRATLCPSDSVSFTEASSAAVAEAKADAKGKTNTTAAKTASTKVSQQYDINGRRINNATANNNTAKSNAQSRTASVASSTAQALPRINSVRVGSTAIAVDNNNNGSRVITATNKAVLRSAPASRRGSPAPTNIANPSGNANGAPIRLTAAAIASMAPPTTPTDKFAVPSMAPTQFYSRPGSVCSSSSRASVTGASIRPSMAGAGRRSVSAAGSVSVPGTPSRPHAIARRGSTIVAFGSTLLKDATAPSRDASMAAVDEVMNSMLLGNNNALPSSSTGVGAGMSRRGSVSSSVGSTTSRMSSLMAPTASSRLKVKGATATTNVTVTVRASAVVDARKVPTAVVGGKQQTATVAPKPKKALAASKSPVPRTPALSRAASPIANVVTAVHEAAGSDPSPSAAPTAAAQANTTNVGSVNKADNSEAIRSAAPPRERSADTVVAAEMLAGRPSSMFDRPRPSTRVSGTNVPTLAKEACDSASPAPEPKSQFVSIQRDIIASAAADEAVVLSQSPAPANPMASDEQAINANIVIGAKRPAREEDGVCSAALTTTRGGRVISPARSRPVGETCDAETFSNNVMKIANDARNRAMLGDEDAINGAAEVMSPAAQLPSSTRATGGGARNTGIVVFTESLGSRSRPVSPAQLCPRASAKLEAIAAMGRGTVRSSGVAPLASPTTSSSPAKNAMADSRSVSPSSKQKRAARAPQPSLALAVGGDVVPTATVGHRNSFEMPHYARATMSSVARVTGGGSMLIAAIAAGSKRTQREGEAPDTKTTPLRSPARSQTLLVARDTLNHNVATAGEKGRSNGSMSPSRALSPSTTAAANIAAPPQRTAMNTLSPHHYLKSCEMRMRTEPNFIIRQNKLKELFIRSKDAIVASLMQHHVSSSSATTITSPTRLTSSSTTSPTKRATTTNAAGQKLLPFNLVLRTIRRHLQDGANASSSSTREMSPSPSAFSADAKLSVLTEDLHALLVLDEARRPFSPTVRRQLEVAAEKENGPSAFGAPSSSQLTDRNGNEIVNRKPSMLEHLFPAAAENNSTFSSSAPSSFATTTVVEECAVPIPFEELVERLIVSAQREF